MKRFKIINANVITPFRLIKNGSIMIEDGKISEVREGDFPENCCCEAIDAKGMYVSPGFIDIHTHGAGGHDFMDATVEAYVKAVEKHTEHGTTSIVPTTLCSTNDELKDTFEVFRKAKAANKDEAEMLGLHLEGPYFSMAAKGAQDPRYIKNPEPKEYNEILSWSDDIIRWSIAPELDGAMELGRALSKKGILPSIGHTDAIYEDVQRAFENGYTHITHLYSCMSGVRRIKAFRYAGVIESAFLIDEMTAEIIADGCHLPPCLLKLVYKFKGPDKVALVTDSMRAAGMPEGESIMGSLKNGYKVIVEDGVAKLMDRSAFAASVATMDRLVRNMIELADVPVCDAVKMATATPAKIIGVYDRKGSIAKGKDADILIFDNHVNIKMVMVKGNIVHNIVDK